MLPHQIARERGLIERLGPELRIFRALRDRVEDRNGSAQ
jgi:hypothetical protein